MTGPKGNSEFCFLETLKVSRGANAEAMGSNSVEALKIAHFQVEFTQASPSKRGLVYNHSYENEYNLQVNGISFSYEMMSFKTRFAEEV